LVLLLACQRPKEGAPEADPSPEPPGATVAPDSAPPEGPTGGETGLPTETETETETGGETAAPSSSDTGRGDTGLPPPPPPPPALVFRDGRVPTNLLVVSLDTTRRDAVGRFGSGLTPRLDAVLAEALVLEDHHSCSNWTAWSMTCLVSGRTPLQNGFATWSSDPYLPGRPPIGYANDTLAPWLERAGFNTALVTANAVFSRAVTGVAGRYGVERLMDYAPAPEVSAVALEELGRLRGAGRPWYLHVHYMDPHGNYCAPEDYVSLPDVEPFGWTLDAWCADSYSPGVLYPYLPPPEQLALQAAYEALYRAEMAYWDEHFGRLWDELSASGALDDALVLFVTDHGQQFLERGGHGHGLFLGDEETRAVAAFWARDLQPGAYTGLTGHTDLAASLQGLFGLRPFRPADGYALGAAPEDRALRLANTWGWQLELGVVSGGGALVYHWFGDRWYFDRGVDPAGLTDTYDPASPQVQAAWGPMEAWATELYVAFPHLGLPVGLGP
jgi:hypothetical protein